MQSQGRAGCSDGAIFGWVCGMEGAQEGIWAGGIVKASLTHFSLKPIWGGHVHLCPA